MATAIISADIISMLIGRQIMTQAISDASNNIYNSLTNLIYYSSDVDSILNELDLGNKIKILEELTKVLNNYKKKNTLIDMALEHMHDMIIRIREDLKKITFNINQHKKKIFSNWRKINCKKELDSLVSHSHILDKRLELLFKTIEIEKNNTK